MKKLLMSIFVISLLAGCASYIPPDKPKEQLAFVIEYEGKLQDIDITSINGVDTKSLVEKMELDTIYKPFSKEFWIDESIGSESFSVEPGQCTIEVHYSESMGDANGTLVFTAKKGNSYRVYGMKETSGKWFKSQWMVFYVFEEQTGLIVGDYPEDLKVKLMEYHNNTNKQFQQPLTPNVDKRKKG